MKKISVFPLLLTAVSLIDLLVLDIHAQVSGEWEYAITDSNQATIVRYRSFDPFNSPPNGSVVTIPSEIAGYPVTTVGVGMPIFESYFFPYPGQSNGFSLVIPNSVTSIAGGAFWMCSRLTNVTFSSSLTNIGGSAFWATGISTAVIPNSVLTIGNGAFGGSKLTNVVLGSGLTNMGINVFESCSGLSAISVNADSEYFLEIEGVLCNKLGTRLVQYPAGKLGPYVIPSTITEIGDSAFSHCVGLTEVTIPTSVTNVGKFAFYKCDGLTNITIPESVTSISEYTFNGCSMLATVNLPNTLTNIGRGAFEGCGNLLDITIPDSVTDIGPWSFCIAGLSTAVIGRGVTNIGESAFERAPTLQSLFFRGDAPSAVGDNALAGTTSTIYYLYGTSGWSSDFAGRPTEVYTLDTDSDSVNDYREIADGTDPTNATSFNALSVGLVAYYPFDGNANDESGNGYSGVLSGSISLTNDKQGSPASAYYFDGTEASIVVTNQVLDLGQSGYTITGWYKSYEPNKSYQTLFNTIPHTGIGIGFTSGFLPGKFPWGIGDGNDWLYFNAGDLQISLQPSSWFHWAFVKDGTFYKMFVNGRRSTDADVPQVAGLSRLAGFRLGSIGANNEAIHGVLDNVRVYNEALTQSRIKAIYFAESFSEADREFVLSHPDAMGHYSQTQYEEYGALQLSNGVSSVINNPSAFNLFTQSEYESFGALQFSNGISSVMSNPSAFNLFTQAEFNSNRTAGQSDVMNSPMSFGLYTSNSIMDLRMGGLMIQKVGTNAVVSFQPQTTTDLTLPFTNNGTPITNTIPMPGNKGFIRINAKP